MKFFKNLKIKTKILTSFIIIIALSLIIGLLSLTSFKEIQGSYESLLSGPTKRLQYTYEIRNGLTLMNQLMSLTVIYTGDSGKLNDLEKQFKDTSSNVNNVFSDYFDSLNNDNELPNDIKSSLETEAKQIHDYITRDFNATYQTILNSSKFSNMELARKLVSEATEKFSELNKRVESLANVAVQSTERNTINTNNRVDLLILILLSIIIFVILISTLIAIYFSKAISKPMLNLSKDAHEIAKGNLAVLKPSNYSDEVGILTNSICEVVDTFKRLLGEISRVSSEMDKGDIDSRINEDSFNGDYAMVASSINSAFSSLVSDNILLLECLEAYAYGDFDKTLKQFPGKKAINNKVLNSLQNNLKSVSNSLSELIQQAILGNLSSRIDIKEYKGDWKELARGVNKLITSIVKPMDTVKEILGEVEKGNFSVSISNKYSGDFASMLNSLETSINNISSYIKEINDVLNKISLGDLTQEIKREYVGEFSTIKDCIKKILNDLNVTIFGINNASVEVLNGGKLILSSATELSSGVSNQASTLEELNASLEMINQKTISNAQSTKKANELSQKSINNAKEGNIEMQHMLKAMEGIKAASDNISNVIKVIENIAFQTNLLALNAAVEAARAGEHGKGFAVVASEVRNLAIRSQEAAKETTSLIEDSISRVNEGSNIAAITAESLKTIVEDANTVSQIVEDISKSSSEQAEAMAMVTSSLNNIANIVQNTSSVSENAASVSEELSAQSESLANLVAFFKLK